MAPGDLLLLQLIIRQPRSVLLDCFLPRPLPWHGPSPGMDPMMDSHFCGVCSRSACSGPSKQSERQARTAPLGRLGFRNIVKPEPSCPVFLPFPSLGRLRSLELPVADVAQDLQANAAIWMGLPRVVRGHSEASPNGHLITACGIMLRSPLPKSCFSLAPPPKTPEISQSRASSPSTALSYHDSPQDFKVLV